MLEEIQKVHLCAKQELMRRMLHAEYRRIFEDGTDENASKIGTEGCEKELQKVTNSRFDSKCKPKMPKGVSNNTPGV